TDVRVAVVERGDLEATVSTTGVIVPRAEQTLASPVSAEIRVVHVSPGEPVSRGQLMIELDTTASALALSNLEEQLALMRAEIRSRDLQNTDAIRQARGRRELLEIDLESRRVMLSRLEELAGTGVVSETEMLEAGLNVKRTQVELDQIAAQIVSLAQRREADLERLELDYSIQDKRREDQARRVRMSQVKGSRDGIVTFILQDEGSFVAEGQTLATIAATDEFRVEASVSDFYGPQLRENQLVRISSATNQFDGYLSRILSVAESNRLDLFIELDDPAAPAFHSNLSVDIEIVTAQKRDVLKITRGPALEGAGIEQLYVISGNRAVRTPVRLGVSERRQIEIIDGVDVGDRIVISDVTAFDDLEIIRIRN
ncbi:MAG TPA: HlyD family efflux transporter periplasmic adaptor subunit, partial [Gammaproteobacteria bacterium]|nr:HlyD family efflux transporter periplasmic adaptor subunit [Gammaproteobacteria bacterium]